MWKREGKVPFHKIRKEEKILVLWNPTKLRRKSCQINKLHGFLKSSEIGGRLQEIQIWENTKPIVRSPWILVFGKRLTGHGSCGPVSATQDVEGKPGFSTGGKERD
jgi:hypothetical protein